MKSPSGCTRRCSPRSSTPRCRSASPTLPRCRLAIRPRPTARSWPTRSRTRARSCARRTLNSSSALLQHQRTDRAHRRAAVREELVVEALHGEVAALLRAQRIAQRRDLGVAVVVARELDLAERRAAPLFGRLGLLLEGLAGHHGERGVALQVP